MATHASFGIWGRCRIHEKGFAAETWRNIKQRTHSGSCVVAALGIKEVLLLGWYSTEKSPVRKWKSSEAFFKFVMYPGKID